MKEPKCFVDEFGIKEWKLNGKLHRLDGPAIELSNGTKLWYVGGNLHRLDGPAVEWLDGTKDWFINGKCYYTEYEHAIGAFLWMNEHERT
jgi:hypothetical protein